MDGLSPTLPLPLAIGHEATLEGRVRRVVYDAPSGDMRIFEMEDDERVVHTIKQYANGAPMTELRVADQLRVLGRFTLHKRFGRQFAANDVVRRTPTTAQGVAKVISGKTFKGIGPKAAQKLVDEFGQDLVSLLNRGDPAEMMSDVVGHRKARALVLAWLENQAVNMTDARLADLGIGAETRAKIRKAIPDVDAVIQTDPYRLAKEVDGIGFQTADQLAMRAGVFREDGTSRLAAGIAHTLDVAGQEGHTGLGRSQLVDRACEVLAYSDRAQVAAIMEAEIARGDLEVSPNDLVQTRHAAIREARLARTFVALAHAAPRMRVDAMPLLRELGTVRERHGLTQEQFDAVASGVQAPVSVVTGGPGTGKTRTIRSIIDVLKRAAVQSGTECVIRCIAPTGKASDRMHESTGHEASTVHMALGRDNERGGFLHRADTPLECDLVIADEFSMMDTRMADALLQAIDPKRTRLIIVGDVHQLASVDPGRVLHDMIESGICPVTRFTVVWRTGPGSAIAIGAAEINEGRSPQMGRPGESEFVFIDERDPQGAQERIVAMVAKGLPAFTGLASTDVQVLSPGKNSAIGVHALNIALQAALNPNPPLSAGQGQQVAIAHGARARAGDRIICTKTDYTSDPPVYNGDVGVVVGVVGTGDEAGLDVDFGKKRLTLERSYWSKVSLSYSLTVHKSQGSEYPIVVIPLTKSHYMMLKRNLLYTGVTRAQRLCVIVGSRDALRIALETTDGTSRQTGLLSRIRAFDRLR